MLTTWKPAAALTALGLALAACQEEQAPADDAAPAAAVAAAELPAPPFSVNRMMVSLIDNEADVLWNAEAEGGVPQNEAEWNRIEDHALQIVAAGYLVARGGTGPEDAQWSAQPEWQRETKAMIDAALAASAAAESKNMENLLTANNRLVDACLNCHQRFKPELPTEGRMRRHAEEQASLAGQTPAP